MTSIALKIQMTVDVSERQKGSSQQDNKDVRMREKQRQRAH